jgi:hypothetical protein
MARRMAGRMAGHPWTALIVIEMAGLSDMRSAT